MDRPAPQPAGRAQRRVAAIGLLSVVALVLGPVAVRLGILAPLEAFLAFLAAVALAAIGLVSGGVTLLRRRKERIRRLGVAATTLYCAGLLITVGTVVARTAHLPPINDVATDLQDPPRFSDSSAPARANAARYPRRHAALQREAYDLAPIVLEVSPETAYRRAVQSGKRLGWTIRSTQEQRRRFEATDRSLLFRFVDDIVVRVRRHQRGAVIDVRSRSRDGRGDLGVNARRIRSFAEAVRRGRPEADASSS